MSKFEACLLSVLLMGCAALDPAAAQDRRPTAEVLIPAGEFTMGFPDAGEHHLPHQVRVGAFFIDTHEVTNAQYHAFCVATERKLPIYWGSERFRCSLDFPDHPIVGVSHADAKAYAEWCGRRLPTEAEWEFAARGGLVGQQFDNGDFLETDEANFVKSAKGGTTPVGSYRPNGYGLYDVVGNVREWVADFYGEFYFRESPVADPGGPEKSQWRVVKGGGWYSGKSCNRVHVRNAMVGSWVDFNVGFRTARDAEE
jgi:formylglycine-generating enzyme required for sulfatase activity